MNYIILNGIKSTLINGLLIQSLPPISKPLLRTQIEEIDGKDGDIVTSLGYSAYNKSFEIGLYGDYDIDEVINFFASAGTVTFSNEPDKYYRYQIFEQIDFERLVMFKTATVTMHVQPFKYSLVDKLKSFDNISNLVIRNNGNTNSRPKITIYGSGNINLSLNGSQIFIISLGNESNITIDAEKMEAFKGNTLKNRLVSGNYENFIFKPGKNTINLTGSITKVNIENFSRWI